MAKIQTLIVNQRNIQIKETQGALVKPRLIVQIRIKYRISSACYLTKLFLRLKILALLFVLFTNVIQEARVSCRSPPEECR
jgi:hypothetical protein